MRGAESSRPSSKMGLVVRLWGLLAWLALQAVLPALARARMALAVDDRSAVPGVVDEGMYPSGVNWLASQVAPCCAGTTWGMAG